MFSLTSYNKLKTNLRLSINRLKLLEKKKTELGLKARKEIADYIANGKEERARIRVEHIVREDYLVEAMELVEMYCDLLLARFGLIQQMKTIDEGLSEAISSLIWAAPRLLGDVAELKVIADQLTSKYGKTYAESCRDNSIGTVSQKLIHKLSVQAPPKVLVERYMIEIAKSHNIPFVPDANAMKADDILSAEKLLIDIGTGPNGVPLLPHSYGEENLPTENLPPFQPSYQPQIYPSNVPEFIGGGPSTGEQAAIPYPPSYLASSPYPNYGAGIYPPAPPLNYLDPLSGLPDLPSVPTNTIPRIDDTVNQETGNDDVDFDSLTRRFEELKKKK